MQAKWVGCLLFLSLNFNENVLVSNVILTLFAEVRFVKNLSQCESWSKLSLTPLVPITHLLIYSFTHLLKLFMATKHDFTIFSNWFEIIESSFDNFFHVAHLPWKIWKSLMVYLLKTLRRSIYFHKSHPLVASKKMLLSLKIVLVICNLQEGKIPA